MSTVHLLWHHSARCCCSLCVMQVQCEAKRVTDNVTINGICSLIPVATCCEPENPEEGLVFVRTLRNDRRREKQVRGPQYHQ